MDDKQRLAEYLQQQLERRKRQDDPAYRKSVNADLSGAQNVSSQNNLAALLMDSASMAGTLGGKRADAGGVARFAQAQNDSMSDFRRGMVGADEARENRYQMDGKVREYLAAKQQAGEDRAATGKYRADTLSQAGAAAKARERGEQARFNAAQQLERDKLKQAGDLKREELAATGEKKNEPKPDQFKVAGFARRLEQAEDVFGDLGKMGYDRTSKLGAAYNAMAPAAMESGAYKANEQAERNFINAVLRRESGASISPTEFESAEKQYFPRPGDPESLVQQKALNRQQVLESLKAEAGTAYDRTPRIEGVAARRKPGAGEAIAAPDAAAPKAPEDMSDAEIDAELERLKGGKP